MLEISAIRTPVLGSLLYSPVCINSTAAYARLNIVSNSRYLIPVKIGDQLSSQRELIDIFEKPIKLDPKAVWLVTETRITNQNDDVVAIGRNTLLTHRTPEQVSADLQK